MVQKLISRMIPVVESQLAEARTDNIVMAPAVSVKLFNGTSSISCVGLIDTGADISVLDRGLFAELGNFPLPGIIRVITSAGSITEPVYLLTIKILGESADKTLNFENVPVITLPLSRPLFRIGRRGILDRLRIELDFPRKEIVLSRSEDNENAYPNLSIQFASFQSIIESVNDEKLDQAISLLVWETEQFLDRTITEILAQGVPVMPGLRNETLAEKFQFLSEQSRLVDPQLARDFKMFTMMRNQVVHSPAFKMPDRDLVERCLSIAERMVSVFSSTHFRAYQP
jgi:predicted aspartyl protease